MMTLMQTVKKEGLLFDGAMGSMLIAAGLKGGKPSELWNLERPEAIQSVHAAYFEAGAQVATANTFGGSAFKLKKMGIDADPVALNRKAVEIARNAAGPDRYVAGDMGPLGEMLKPAGMLDEDQARGYFAEQAAVLKETGVDFFILETFFDLNEIKAAVQGIRSVSDLPVFATMTFQKKGNRFFTLMGNTPVDSLKQLLDSGAQVVGANCSLPSDTMIELAREISEGIDGPVMIQPNAGAPERQGETVIYPETVDFFSDNILTLKKMGIEVVGGCCGTTPEFIRVIREKTAALTGGN